MCRLLAAIIVCKICVAFMLLTALPGVAGNGEPAGVPLPELCYGTRGDRTVSRNCTDSSNRVQRFFFNSRRNICKRFGACQSIATHLDELADPTINYFQDIAECKQACPNVVECLQEPLVIANGSPGMVTEEGEWAQLEPDQRLGFGATVTFRCDKGYGLPEGVWNRTCQLSGTWSGATPSCNIQCPKPDRYSVSPLRNYYNIGDQIRVDCMDGHVGSNCLTCLPTGNWEGDYPSCSRSCAPLPVDNADPPVVKMEGSTVQFMYTCHAGYTLLNNFRENSTLSSNNYTLSCVDGTFEGQLPVCTRVEIRSTVAALSTRNGVYYYQMEEGSRNKVLTCGLEGVEVEDQYPAQWILPRKPNGELPPETDTNGNKLTFHTALQGQNETYICNICNVNTSVIVRVSPTTDENRPPIIHFFHPNGSLKGRAGRDIIIRTFIIGARPMHIVWQHNNSNITNITNNSHYQLSTFITPEKILNTLTIRGIGEDDQGTYQIVVNNSRGTSVSPQATLMLLDTESESGRRRRSTPLCEEEQTGKVVLSGVVRRLGRTQDDLETITLRVNRVLRGEEGSGIASSDKVEVRIFSGDDTKRLHRGKHVILSGVPAHSSQQRIIYMFDSPVLDYSPDTERAISDC